jgi:hypothetical protein
MDLHNTDQHRFKRRRFKRSVVVLLLLASVGMLLWVTKEIHHAAKQRKAIGVIRKLGGTTLYDWQLIGQSEPPGPNSLRTLLGVDFFANVAKVNLSNTRVTDAELEILTDLPQLVMLRLDNTQVTDAGLKYVGRLRQLCVLWLSNTKISDTGLEYLKGLKKLQILLLGDTQITDTGLKYIEGLDQLEILWVRGTHVTHDGLKKLQHTLPDCNTIK